MKEEAFERRIAKICGEKFRRFDIGNLIVKRSKLLSENTKAVLTEYLESCRNELDLLQRKGEIVPKLSEEDKKQVEELFRKIENKLFVISYTSQSFGLKLKILEFWRKATSIQVDLEVWRDRELLFKGKIDLMNPEKRRRLAKSILKRIKRDASSEDVELLDKELIILLKITEKRWLELEELRKESEEIGTVMLIGDEFAMKLIQSLIERGVIDKCFMDLTGETYALIRDNSDIWTVIRVDSREFADFLTYHAVKVLGKLPSSDTSIRVVQRYFRFKASQNKKTEIFNRIGSVDGRIYYDLADKEGRIVEITGKGWKIKKGLKLPFLREKHMLPQTELEEGGNMELLLEYLPIKDKEFVKKLLLPTLVSMFNPAIATPILSLQGPPGSGKTLTCKVLRQIVDPSACSILSFPDQPRELVQALHKHYLAPFDNITKLEDWQSDCLARAITGEAFMKRRLYTDADDVIFVYRRKIVLNGINFDIRSDILDRSLIIELERIPKNKRKLESVIFGNLRDDQPKILGGIFDVLSEALAIAPDVLKEVEKGEVSLPRLADFAVFAEACARAMDLKDFEFLDNFILHQQELNFAQSEMVRIIVSYLRTTRNVLAGTPTDVYNELKTYAESIYDRKTAEEILGRSVIVFGRKLREVEGTLKDLGVIIVSRTASGPEGRRELIIELRK